MPATGTLSPGDRVKGGGSLRGLLLSVPMLPVTVIVFIIFAMTVTGFTSPITLNNMALQFSPLMVCAIGATMVFLIGGIDLSVGSVMSLAAVVGALLMRESDSVTLGILAGLCCGLVVGAVNGLSIAVFRLTPFVQTLAALLTVRALAFLISGGHSIGRLPPGTRTLSRTPILGLPAIVWFSIAAAIVAWLVISRTQFGRNIYLLGANRRAAIFSGMDVRRLEFLVYTLAGTLSAAGGMIAVLWLNSAAPVLGDPVLLQVIAAVVIGGTSIMGGYGGIVATVTGVVLIVMLNRGFDLAGLAFYDQSIALGIVVLAGSGLGEFLGRYRVRRAESSDAAAEPSQSDSRQTSS